MGSSLESRKPLKNVFSFMGTTLNIHFLWLDHILTSKIVEDNLGLVARKSVCGFQADNAQTTLLSYSDLLEY